MTRKDKPKSAQELAKAARELARAHDDDTPADMRDALFAMVAARLRAVLMDLEAGQ